MYTHFELNKLPQKLKSDRGLLRQAEQFTRQQRSPPGGRYTQFVCTRAVHHHKGFSEFSVKTYKIAAFLQYLFSGNKS